MKLHLPSKLLQALLAVFATATITPQVWAAETRSITLTEDKLYGYGGESCEGEPWNLDASINLYISSNEENPASLHFDGSNESLTSSVISAGDITVESLKSFGMKNITQGYPMGIGMYVPYSGKITFNNIGQEATGDAIVVTGNASRVEKHSTLGGWLYGKELEIKNTTGHIKVADNTISTSGGENYATNGAGIACEGLINIHDNDGDITFSGNEAFGEGNTMGGAICALSYEGTGLNISGNGMVAFSNNLASGNTYTLGGAIGALADQIIQNNTGVSFKENQVIGKVNAYGGALQARGGVNISSNVASDAEADSVSFIGNKVISEKAGFGGAIAATVEEVTIIENPETGYDVVLENNGNVNFENNTIEAVEKAKGGAICADNQVLIHNNQNISFTSNSAEAKIAQGGAIYSNGEVIIGHNKNVDFTSNNIYGISDYSNYTSGGGAIYSSSDVILINNESIKFQDNEVIFDNPHHTSVHGGAISADGDVIIGGENSAYGNGDVIFSGNTISSTASEITGGAIYSGDKNGNGVTISHNKSVLFENNTLRGSGLEHEGGYGAAIHVNGSGKSVVISNNSGNVTFKNNIAEADGGVNGAAIMISAGGAIIYDNKDVIFEGNASRANSRWSCGAAIGSRDDVLIALNDNVTISNNTSINYNIEDGSGALNIGGAIGSANGITLISYNKGNVNITNNGLASRDSGGQSISWGGAIFANGASFVGNGGNVTFSGNFESGSDGTFLRSLYIGNEVFELAAADNKEIVFYDSIYVRSGNDVTLNFYQDLTANGEVKITTGNIVFSGARTEQDLATVHEYLKSQNFSALTTDNDIEASRTSIIERNVYVATGTLRVEDGAVLKLQGSNTGYDLILVNGKEMGPQMGIEFKPELSAKLEVSAGSRIEAANIDLGATAIYTSKVGLMQATTLSLKEASIPAAELQAATVTLHAGMTYNQDGAITLLVGDANTLVLDATNGESFIFNVDESLAYTQDENIYFVLFTGVEDYTLKGIESLDKLLFMHNLEQYNDIALGFHDDTGTLYLSAKSNSIPEPATATLSLLALAALAARRRRR